MTRVIIICEGQTEKDFAKKIVAPHLLGLGIDVSSTLLGKPGKKGGDVRSARVIGDITTFLKNDKTALCTTFFDFYGMKPDVPGRGEAGNKSDHKEKKKIVEDAIFKAVEEKVGDAARRFKPYIQMHEFEGLLFSNIQKMSSKLSDGDNEVAQKIQSEFGKILETKSPEEINDGRETAPSKRIKKMVFGYKKTTDGINLAEDIGLQEIRKKCPLFNEWMNWLESLSKK